MRKRLLNLEGSVEFLSENIKNLIETTGYHETSVGIVGRVVHYSYGTFL